MPDPGTTGALVEWVGVDGSLALGVVAIICALGVPLPVTVRLLALSALKLPTS